MVVPGSEINIKYHHKKCKYVIQFWITLGPIAQSVASTTGDSGVPSSIPARSHTFVETDHEIISTVILFLLLIQEGLLSVTSKSLCTKYWLTT